MTDTKLHVLSAYDGVVSYFGLMLKFFFKLIVL